MLDEAKLRGITSTGVPDQGELRPVLWRVLLRYGRVPMLRSSVASFALRGVLAALKHALWKACV